MSYYETINEKILELYVMLKHGMISNNELLERRLQLSR